MAKANLGTKRVCPETGRKFYDLDKDPIVSPYTGKEYAISFFEGGETVTAPKPDEAQEEVKTKAAEETAAEEETVELDDDAPEIISLDDAEEDDSDDDEDGDDIPDIPDIPDVDLNEDDDVADGDDTFLEEDDEDDNLSDVIVGVDDKDEEV